MSTTPAVSLLTMEEATSTEAVAEFAGQVLDGTGWELVELKRRASRLEPPQAYWVIYEAVISKDEEERRLRLVARGAFDQDAWEDLRDKLIREGHGHPCDPQRRRPWGHSGLTRRRRSASVGRL